jgi:hypothetical protein
MWCRVTWLSVWMFWIREEELQTIEDEGAVFLWDFRSWLPRGVASYPRTDSSTTQLWQPQNLHVYRIVIDLWCHIVYCLYTWEHNFSFLNINWPVSIMTRWQVGQERDQDSFPGRGRDFQFTASRTVLGQPVSCQMGPWQPFPCGLKQLEPYHLCKIFNCSRHYLLPLPHQPKSLQAPIFMLCVGLNCLPCHRNSLHPHSMEPVNLNAP